MKWLLNILGILFVLTGIVWILQGTGIVPVGGMAYQSQWTYIGVALVIVAVILFILANRRRKLPPAP